jgi:hypothetical protein
MSQEELLKCEEMLKILLLPDNEKRKVGESQLQQCLISDPNRIQLTIYCSHILNRSTDLGVQTYCAIIIRKVFLQNENENKENLYKILTEEQKSIIKQNLINALQNMTNNSIRKKVSDAAICFFEFLVGNGPEDEEDEEEKKENDNKREKWDEFLKFIINLLILELNEQNYKNIELGLYLMSNVYALAHNQLKEEIKKFLANFKKYFECNSLPLKAQTVKCINELLCNSLSKKESKKFVDFIFLILKTTYECLQVHDMDNLKVCIESIRDLSSCEPKILRKSFNDIYILMGKIINDKEVDDSLREISYEIIISIYEEIPKLAKEDSEKIKMLVQSLFKYAMELDQTIDDDWLNPSRVSFISDEFIPEHKLDEVTSLISRLFNIVDEEQLIKLIKSNITELIAHSSDTDWKYKYIAYITVAEIVEQIQLSEIETLLKMIFADLFNKNIKIQYSCIYCIAELANEHNPDFQNTYHAEIVPNLIKLLNESTCLRIQLEICDALQCFVEHLSSGDSAKYMESSLDALFKVFMKDENECPPSLKEGILNVVEEFIDSSEESFKQYSDKCFTILLEYLSIILQKNINRNLVGPLLQVISMIGPLCPELYKKHINTLANTLIQINLNIPNFQENIANYLMSTWEKFIPYLIEENKEKIPEIVNSLITLLKKPPEMSISSNPQQKIDVQKFFASDENKTDKEKEEKKNKVELKTSETEEFATFIEILNLFLSSCPQLYPMKIIDNLYEIANKLISYPNSDIKEEICRVFEKSIKILIKLNSDKNLVNQIAKDYISIIVEKVMKESDNTVIIAFVDTIRDIIKAVGRFLDTNEINQLSAKILKLFEDISKGRESLIKQKNETQQKIEIDKKTGNNKIYSDDEDDDESEEDAIENIKEQIDEVESTLSSLSDFFSTIFETHKELTLQLVEQIIKTYLPKFLQENSSNFEKTLGVLLVTDMVEFLEQDLLNNIWADMVKILLQYSSHPHFEIRNASCYGLGIFSKVTKKDYSLYAKDILNAIMSVIKKPIDKDVKGKEKENIKFARDNAVSALCKIIQYHGQEFPNDLDNLIDFWVNSLPITKDKEEAKINIKFLLDILMKEPNRVLGNNNKNLGNIIITLAKGYKTSSTDKDIDAIIDTVAENLLKNEEYKKIIEETYSNTKKRTQNKIRDLFKLPNNK